MADILPEKWMKGVAVTTTILAVLTAIAASRGGACTATTQILTAVETGQWSYFQAKSIKQNLREAQKDQLETMLLAPANTEQRTLLENKLKEVSSEIIRYGQEKEEIRATAEGTGRKNATVARRGNQFSFAVVFFQIGIMLSSVSALLKRKEMWLAGVLFGLVAMVFLANGFFLFF